MCKRSGGCRDYGKYAFASALWISSWGGSEELWASGARQLIEGGATVAANVQGWAFEVPPLQDLERLGCTIARRQRRGRIGRAVRLALRKSDFDWLDTVRDCLVVISQAGNLDGAPWMLECLRRRIPYVTIAQAAGEQHWPEDDQADCARRGYEGAAACYFVSQANLDLTRRELAAPLPHAKIVRNPFKVSYDAAPAWPAECTPDSLKLACVGRLDAKTKGQDLIFEVLRKPKWRDRPVRVTLYGSGPNEAVYRALVRCYDLQSVCFAGHVKDIESIWLNHHALILPSRHEGLPIAIVEAMLCGRPCIVTDIAGNAELLEDNRSGFVAKAPTIDLLDEAMERAWQRRAELQSMGQAAAKRVRQLVPRDPVGEFVEQLRSHLR